MTEVIKIRHPDYVSRISDWQYWRRAYDGGKNFVRKHLTKFSDRESDASFKERLDLTYVPAFAATSISEIKNAIFRRFNDIDRKVDSETYNKAITGSNGGIDRKSGAISNFIGDTVLTELLVQAKVGVFVDMPNSDAPISAYEAQYMQPYMYIYRAEDILSWSVDPNTETLTSVLLIEQVEVIDDDSGLVARKEKQYRHYRKTEEGVTCTIYGVDGKVRKTITAIGMKEIPMAIAELPNSLMERVVDYQTALMQLTSSDLMYSIKANFPIYTEQGTPAYSAAEAAGITGRQHRPIKPESRAAAAVGSTASVTEPANNTDGSQSVQQQKNPNVVTMGATIGRRYSIGSERPGFIHPSSEPLTASMEKEEQMKKEIRQLVHLTVKDFSAKMASADSKDRDNLPLESGLSYVGLILQKLEVHLARLWCAYEKNNRPDITIKYPTDYSIDNQEETNSEIKSLTEEIDTVPSLTFKKLAAQRIARLRLRGSVSQADMDKIVKEIESATIIVASPKIREEAVREGFLSKEDAAKAATFPETTVAIAKKEHEERVIAIAKAQAEGNPAARGNPDVSPEPAAAAAAEKDGKNRRGTA